MIDVRNSIPSTNYGWWRPKIAIDSIFFHHIVGDADDALARFRKPNEQASSTYVIGSDGTVYYVVSENRVPYTNGGGATQGTWNWRSITIEHAGGGGRPYTEAMYKASEQLVKDIRKRYPRIKNFKRHREVYPTICPGDLNVERIVRNSNPKIEGEDMVSTAGVHQIYRSNLGRAASSSELNQYVGKVPYDQLLGAVKNSKEFKDRVAKVKANYDLAKDHLPAEMR